MGLFKKAGTSFALIDIRSSSVGAAYAVIDADRALTLVYSARVPLDPHATEPLAEALPRTLEKALGLLVSEGAPLLHAMAGTGKADHVYVTFTAPWQHSEVRSAVIENEKPFVFTQELLNESVADEEGENKGRTRVSQMIIATLLNGYEVQNPFGKKVNRAELILLSSSLPDDVTELVTKEVRKALHQHQIEFNAFMPEAFVAMQDLYPHQRDFLVLDVGNDATDMLLIKHGLLISISSMAHGVSEITRAAQGMGVSSPAVPLAAAPLVDMGRNTSFASKVEEAEREWLQTIRTELGEIAKQEPLPRTVFLLAEENVRDFLARLLDAPELRSLWLSDEALAIMPVLPIHFAPFVGVQGNTEIDPTLALLALSAAKRL
ncbi:MAG: hypothetical protein JWO84_436 [Parcubacteria group bacterium]|nr:hypothetical protein [Parcubacteria group bacterium]